MAYDHMSDEELLEYAQNKASGNRGLVWIGIFTLVIGIGVLIILYAYMRVAQSLRARREYSRRMKQDQVYSTNYNPNY